MRHILFCCSREGLVDDLRHLAGDSTTFLVEHDIEAALERLGRSARIDGVVTDDPALLAAIREEIPGVIPVYLANPEETSDAIWKGLIGIEP